MSLFHIHERLLMATTSKDDMKKTVEASPDEIRQMLKDLEKNTAKTVSESDIESSEEKRRRQRG